MSRGFDDVLAANAAYSAEFSLRGLAARAAKGLCVLTCMDSRIEPLAMLGLRPGDAKILRNAGGRVTDNVLKTLVVATYLLGVDRLMVIAHTNCRMAGSEEALHRALDEAGAPDTSHVAFGATADQRAALQADVERVRSYRLLPTLETGGFLYDVATGRIEQIA